MEGMKWIKISLLQSKSKENSWDLCPAWLLVRVTEGGGGLCGWQLIARFTRVAVSFPSFLYLKHYIRLALVVSAPVPLTLYMWRREDHLSLGGWSPAWTTGLRRVGARGPKETTVLWSKSTREHTQTLLRPNKKYVWHDLPKSCSPEPHHFLLFEHKNHILGDTVQLEQLVRSKNYRNQKQS